MEEIIDIILEPSSDEINKKNKILDIFLNIINDLSKEETITFIKKLFTLIKANNSELLIRVLPKILELTESYYEEISEIIYECNFTDYFLKKYKKIDLSDLDLFCSYNYLLEVLKKINNKYLICDSFSECKKLNNTQSKYYMVLSKTNNLNNIYGIEFYKTRLKNNISTLLQNNDYNFILEYYKIYKTLIDKKEASFEQMISEDLFIYIMNLNRNIPFIKEMQEYFEKEFNDNFIELNKLSIKYRNEFINGDFTNFDNYFRIHNIAGNTIDDTLANYVLNMAFNNSEYIGEESIIAAIKSLGNTYLETFGINGYSIVIKNAFDMNLKSGIHEEYPNKVITINKSLIKLFLKTKNIRVFTTLFHEIEHAKIEQKNSNYFEYQMQKEKIVARNINGYYLENYEFILEEIDARLNGCINTFRYLEQLIPDKVDYYKEVLLNDIKKENELLEKFNNSSDTIYSFGDEIDILFEKIVKEKPSIIKRNPLFCLEYNLDGSTKSDLELLNEYNSLNKNEKNIVKKILELRLNTDIFSLINKLRYLENNTNDIVLYYVDIIFYNILNEIKNYNKKEIISYLYSLNDNVFISELINKIENIKQK